MTELLLTAQILLSKSNCRSKYHLLSVAASAVAALSSTGPSVAVGCPLLQQGLQHNLQVLTADST